MWGLKWSILEIELMRYCTSNVFLVYKMVRKNNHISVKCYLNFVQHAGPWPWIMYGEASECCSRNLYGERFCLKNTCSVRIYFYVKCGDCGS